VAPDLAAGLASAGHAPFTSMEGRSAPGVLPLSAITPAQKIVTLEGLDSSESLHPLQRAFIEEQAVQCGYCINGMIMQAADFLSSAKNPSETEIKNALANNLCRWGTHVRIVRAIKRAASA